MNLTKINELTKSEKRVLEYILNVLFDAGVCNHFSDGGYAISGDFLCGLNQKELNAYKKVVKKLTGEELETEKDR